MKTLKDFLSSKINWSGILLVLMSLLPVIENQNFDGMTVKDWVVFAIGLLIVIFRTWFTAANKPAPAPEAPKQ